MDFTAAFLHTQTHTFSACDKACKDACTDAGPENCDECASGYVDEEGVCEDKDECSEEESLCEEGRYCLNTPGSYRCNGESSVTSDLPTACPMNGNNTKPLCF